MNMPRTRPLTSSRTTTPLHSTKSSSSSTTAKRTGPGMPRAYPRSHSLPPQRQGVIVIITRKTGHPRTGLDDGPAGRSERDHGRRVSDAGVCRQRAPDSGTTTARRRCRSGGEKGERRDGRAARVCSGGGGLFLELLLELLLLLALGEGAVVG